MRRRFMDKLKSGLTFSAPTVDPEDILREQDPDSVPADAPPDSANYRQGDVQGINCANCSKFSFEGVIEAADDGDGGMIPIGTCDLWEAKVKGDMVSDGFADSSPPLDENGNEDWSFSDADTQIETEFFNPHGNFEFAEGEDLVWKEIFQTGEWEVTPTAAGPIKKKLRVIDEGKTDLSKGVLALSDIEQSFADRAFPHVEVPLTDEPGKDHKQMARLNQGFVRKLKRVKDGNLTRLLAGIHITEPETKEKISRGTYADVSAGIFPKIDQRTGKRWPAALKHVVITNTPFHDGMLPWGVTASDQQPSTVISYQPADTIKAWTEKLSNSWRTEQITAALRDQLHLPDHYVVKDIAGSTALVFSEIGETSWYVPFTVVGDGIQLAATADWEEGPTKESEDESKKDDEPAPTPAKTIIASFTPLQAARRARKLRSPDHRSNGGSAMPLTAEELAGLELSDDARQAVSALLDENATLRGKNRVKDADARIEELKAMGFSEAPGFLKFYRQIYLSDDGEPAAVLFSDDDCKIKEAELSALAILDRAIDALPKEDDKILFSGQALVTADDTPPPATDNGDHKPVEERVKEAREFLHPGSTETTDK